MKKTILIFASIIVLSFLILPTASMQQADVEYKVGCKVGDWVKLELDTNITSIKTLKWIKIDVLAINGTRVKVNVTWYFRNETSGEERYYSDTHIEDVASDEGFSPPMIVASGLDVGDPIYPNGPTINKTGTYTAKGATFKVVILEWEYRSLDEYSKYIIEWERSSGIVVHYSGTFKYSGEPTYYFDLKATDGSILKGSLLGGLGGNETTIIIGGIAGIVIIAIIIYVVRRR